MDAGKEGDFIMAYGLQTYQVSTRKEDLADLMGDVSPDENPLGTMLAKTTASQTLHEWTEEYISRPTSTSYEVEGAEATFSDLTAPARRNNVTHIIRQTFKVSGTEDAVANAAVADPYGYQQSKAMKVWKNQQEYNLIWGARASGDSGVARQMAGIQNIITSHYTARNSGTSLSETEFNDMVFDVANDVGSNDVFDIVLLTLRLKQKVSTFTAGSTKYVQASDKRLTRPVSVYESDFGVHRLFPHKDVRSAAATPGPTVIGLKEDKWRIAYLKDRAPKSQELPENGDYKAGMILGELTLEFLAERANAMRTGYNQTG